MALRITRDPDAADDAVQTGFEKALHAAARFEGRSQPSTWLHRIVVNEALMHLRRERRRRDRPGADAALDTALDGIEVDRSATSPLDDLLAREREQLLRDALGALDAADRGVLAACALEGESYASFARRRGLDPGAVKSRAFRARRRLQADVRARTRVG